MPSTPRYMKRLASELQPAAVPAKRTTPSSFNVVDFVIFDTFRRMISTHERNTNWTELNSVNVTARLNPRGTSRFFGNILRA